MKRPLIVALSILGLFVTQWVWSNSGIFTSESKVSRMKATLDSLAYEYDMAYVDSAVSKKFNKRSHRKHKRISWADSVYQSMSPDERLGQLFMVAAWSNKDEKHKKEIEKLICDYHIGGIMFMQGGPYREAQLCNNYQALSKTPLLVSMDAEWGLAMRLDSVAKYPKQMTLGAIQDDSLIYKMGVQIGRECKRLGIQVNFAPVVDINSNPANPVIGYRSFGENKYNVARKGIAYMKGMQSQHVLSNAKHFPGHGDTDVDSHKALPVINHSRARMDSIELYPFVELIKNGLSSTMVAHLNIPAYDTSSNSASSLSKAVVTSLLKDSLKFKGLVFTDALNMKGVSSFHKPGVVDAKALLAGNDVLLFAEDVPTAIEQIKLAIDSCQLSWKDIYTRCYKILKAKEWAGLNHLKPIDLSNLGKDLNSLEADLLNRKLYEASLTLLSNKETILPLKRLDTLKIASVSFGDRIKNTFQKTLDNYAAVTHFNLTADASKKECDSLVKTLSKFNLVLACLNNTNVRPAKNFGVSEKSIELLDSIQAHTKVVLTVLANPACLSKFKNPLQFNALVMGYEESEYSQRLCASLIFGGATSKGKLAFTVPGFFKAGDGIDIGEPVRFRYCLPEEAGIAASNLSRIDTIVTKAIKEHAAPGCQVLVAQNGKVVYQKSFGTTTYETPVPIENDFVYDIASVTKVAASVLSLMKLYESGKIELDSGLAHYLPELKGTSKGNLTLREILTHQAGLKAWIPFWKNTMENGEWKTSLYCKTPSARYSTQVADSLYILTSYKDSIYATITASPIDASKKYLYSDLGYYYIKQIIEKITADSLQNYVTNIYNQLGMSTTCYLPKSKIELNKIVPTENDSKFRKQLLRGYVHDQGAALLGGVGGHAGLFSDANDLAKLMQLYLNNGSYGGETYLRKETMQLFTDCQYCPNGNRRAIGFDKPEPDPSKEDPCCSCVSLLSYGHTGFTGTMVWIDPQYQLVYVFLSNRVYPDAENKKLVQMGVRTKVQEAIYDALK
ncbi:MAG: serine hydrolase [Bacteroidetes bacterium]|nr:serine hydrolase [Bacteroidota bacterium]